MLQNTNMSLNKEKDFCADVNQHSKQSSTKQSKKLAYIEEATIISVRSIYF